MFKNNRRNKDLHLLFQWKVKLPSFLFHNSLPLLNMHIGAIDSTEDVAAK